MDRIGAEGRLNAGQIGITIAIPTFNRVESVLQRVDEILQLDLPHGSRLLVVDNHSQDGTFERLVERFGAEPVRLLQNDRNIGFPMNVFRVINESDSEYVLILSDEDRLEGDGFRRLVQFCQERTPSFVSPRAQVGSNELYRGRSSSRPILPEEFESASFYLSGLTFNTQRAKSAIRVLEPLVQTNSAVAVYPQVLIAALLIAQKNSYFLDALVSRQLDSHPSTITDPTGISYHGVAGRWAQIQGFEEFFASERTAGSPGIDREWLERMCIRMRQQAQRLLMDAAVKEIPQLQQYRPALPIAQRMRDILRAWMGRA